MAGLPPPPINDKPGSFTWLEWYRQLRNYVSTSGSVPWYILNFQGSNITDIALRDHNQLQNTQGGTAGEKYHLTAAQYSALTAGPHNSLSGIQGGTSGEYYHLTNSQVTNLLSTTDKTDLTDGNSSSLHYHTSDRDRANHTGTQAVGTITGLGTAATQSGLSVTITTAKLTGGGVNGSMTFTDGVLTSQTAAT